MKPNIFIGSSVEGHKLAEAIQIGLNHEMRPKVWSQAFPLSGDTVTTLYENFSKSDFAVFVFSADDNLDMRGKILEVVRDNVLFEAGLFMGMHGRKRVFIVVPQNNPGFHLPSDLLGFTTANYDAEWAKADINGAVGAAVGLIKQAVNSSIASQKVLSIETSPSLLGTATWPLKLNVQVTNKEAVSVAVESKNFIFAKTDQQAPNMELTDGVYIPKFLIYQDVNTRTDVYEPYCLLAPYKTLNFWIPFDPTIGEMELQKLAKARACGMWNFRCVWMEAPPVELIYQYSI